MSPVSIGMTSDGARAVPGHVPLATGQLAIVGASLIDATSQRPRPNQTVVVCDGRITEVGDADLVDVPADVAVLDAHGMFLLPGLWDMHVHQFDPSYLELHLRNGVTGIRHMGGIPAHHDWRREIAEGTLLGPRTIVVSPSSTVRHHYDPDLSPSEMATAPARLSSTATTAAPSSSRSTTSSPMTRSTPSPKSAHTATSPSSGTSH